MEERTLFEREEATQRAERALRELREGFAEGRTQLGSTLIFSGAAGTGKTTLIETVRRSAIEPRSGFTVVSARGGQLLRESPYTVVRGLLQAELARYGKEERQELFGTWYDLAAPALGLIPSPQGRPLDPLGVRTALSWVVSQLVRTGPLVLTVDDLHWADAESLAWLAEFSQLHLAQLPILLVLAYRPGELPDGVQELSQGPDAHTVAVEPLGQEAALELLRSELGEETEEVFANECWVVTNGNPYELVYLIGRLKDQGLPPTEETVPRLRGIAASGRGDAIVRALENSDPDTKRFVQAAAVLDHEDFTVDLAAKLAVVRPSNVEAVVESLRESRILDRKETPGFVHPTIATAIYQRMSAATKTAFHGAAVKVLTDAGKPLSVISRHLIETYPEDDPQVVEMLRAAAVEHLAMGAPSAAVRCLERALEEPPLNEDYATVRFELGRALLLTNPVATVGHLRAALDAKDGLDADMREEAVLRLGQALAHSGRMDEAVNATGGAMPQFRADADPGRTVRLQAAYYMWWSFLRDVDEGGNSRRLEEIADGLTGQDAATRAVQVVRAWDMTQRGLDSIQVLELAVQGWRDNRVGHKLAQGLEWTNTTWGFEIPVLLGLVYAYNDRLDVAGKLFQEAHHAFEVAGWTGGHLGFADFMSGFVMFRRGRLLAAEKQLRSTLKRSDRIARGTPLQWDAVAVLVETLLAQGRTADAWKLAQEYQFGPPFSGITVIPDAPTLYGRLLLARGETEQAISQLEEAGAQLDRRGWQNPLWAPWKGLLAQALAAKDPVRARRLAGEGRTRAERLGINSAVGVALRDCAAVTADAEEELELLRTSVEKLGQSPAAYEYAVSTVAYGSALRRSGRAEEAAEYLDQAERDAVRLGAQAVAERARNERLATGVPQQVPRVQGMDELTEQERVVALRRAHGQDIGQIAAETHTSIRVVRMLLASVHHKLGLGPDGLRSVFGEGEE